MEVLLSKKAKKILADPIARKQLAEALDINSKNKMPIVELDGKKYFVVFGNKVEIYRNPT